MEIHIKCVCMCVVAHRDMYMDIHERKCVDSHIRPPIQIICSSSPEDLNPKYALSP